MLFKSVILTIVEIIFIILLVSCLVFLKVSSTENVFGITPYQWIGFFFGFGFGCIFFVLGVIAPANKYIKA